MKGKHSLLRGEYAVSPIIGGMILIVIAVAAFAVIYNDVTSKDLDIYRTNVKLEGSVTEKGLVILEHKGGDVLNSYSVDVYYPNNSLISSNIYNSPWKISETRYPLDSVPGFILENDSDSVRVIVSCVNEDGDEQEVFNAILYGRVSTFVADDTEDSMLISSLRTNTAEEDLICYNYTISSSLDAFSFIYNWTLDDETIFDVLYAFDTDTGIGDVKDYSGNDKTGVVSGPVWSADGRVGGSLMFDGSDDYVTIPYCFDNPLISSFTFETWVMTNTSYVPIVSFDRDRYWELSVKEERLHWTSTANGNTVELSGVTVINDLSWHHVAASYDSDSGNVTLFVDGFIDKHENIHNPGDWIGNGDQPDGFIGTCYDNMITASWETLTYDDFEDGFGNYTDGGRDCLLYTGGAYAHQGDNAADIEDNSGDISSFYYTSGVDVDSPGYTNIRVDFWFIANSMEWGEDFWVKYWDGSSWNIVGDFDSGDEFVNGQFYHEIVWINETSYTFPSDMKIRFECSASSDFDDVYIDEIYVNATIGQTNMNNYSGNIDEFCIYNNILSNEQVHQNYLCKKDGKSDKSVIVSDETSVGDSWRCYVTPNDRFQDDIVFPSNTLNIINYNGGD